MLGILWSAPEFTDAAGPSPAMDIDATALPTDQPKGQSMQMLHSALRNISGEANAFVMAQEAAQLHDKH